MKRSRRPSRAKKDPAEVLFFGGRLLDAPRARKLPAPGRARPLRKGSGGEAVLVRGGRIEAVGPFATLRRRVSRGAELVDLEGGTLTPGFTDAHIHLITWIRAMDEPWMDAQTPESVERAVRSRLASAPREEWILVRGFVPREWTRERRSRAMLDRLAPDRPLVLYAVDGHSVWANGAALSRAGIGEGTADPPGGVVDRDPATGALTGILIEAADRPLRAAVVHGETPASALQRALARARGLGITSAHDFDRSATWRAAQELERDLEPAGLGFRLLLSVPLASLEAALALGLQSGLGGARLRIGHVKMFADGTLGSATALLESPYEGSSQVGIEVTRREDLAEACERAAQAGLSVAIHAIGDRAVRNALDAIEAPLRRGLRYPLPPRVEHVQLAREADFPRFREIGAVASIQPIHQVTDREIARRHWGNRTERSYAWRSLLRAGAALQLGSDAPFDRPGPLLAIQAALTRRAAGEDESRSFHKEQRIGLADALRAHLEEPHRVAGWPEPLGRIAPGFGADLVRWNEDFCTIPIDSWHQAATVGVWVGGTGEIIEKT
jgi:predicted amidohydrolase YtcJ